jgi:hypothetical protein
MRKTIAHSLLLPLRSGVIKFDNPIDVTDDEERVSDEVEDDDAVGVFMVFWILLTKCQSLLLSSRPGCCSTPHNPNQALTKVPFLEPT